VCMGKLGCAMVKSAWSDQALGKSIDIAEDKGLATAKGLLFGLGFSLVFWIAVALVVWHG
jgi:hypothetical protein